MAASMTTACPAQSALLGALNALKRFRCDALQPAKLQFYDDVFARCLILQEIFFSFLVIF